ncbi:MAG: TetR/AcrR family transcriptional regulator [Deltaproteobacteria bacterium]|nr:MAG: TetR/AcrR family transcriptional regulator [Deltaproteobacteria bacterium]
MRRTPRDEARQARTSVYRQHILEAAERVFADRGFDAAKVQEISQLAALSMGTIYAIFPSKHDLHRAILELRGEELLDLARTVAARRLPPREALRALIEVYVDYFLAHPAFLRMHLRAGTSWAMSPLPGTDEQIEKWQEIHELQADVFRRGIADGVFVKEDPGYLARMFTVMDQVLLSDWVSSGMKARRPELVRRLGQLVERAFCRPASERAHRN